jgi:exodeoxyribonuclease-1
MLALMATEPTLFFYDLETSGQDPRRHRIVQFAGRRTTMDLEPIGEPINLVVKLADDILPEPMATLITGITPQSTQSGITESELVRILHREVLTPETTMVGFNNVRFDDEYLRFTFYRNFYDAYEWAWKDGRSRWDLLDVVRMTRALRPEGIEWPNNNDGDPINTLVSLSFANHLLHAKAHDAMSDVDALIAIAELIKAKQPRLWTYLYSLRAKAAVTNVISPESPVPFVYTSGLYGKANAFTSVAGIIASASRAGSYYVYDLRTDPAEFFGLTVEELQERLFTKRDDLAARGLTRLPVKELSLNKCPAVAPLVTLTPDAANRLGLDIPTLKRHWQSLQISELPTLIKLAYNRNQDYPTGDVDGALYDGFIEDKAECATVRTANETTIGALAPKFRDTRLEELLIRYKGRNFPGQLTAHERTAWEAYRTQRILTDIEAWSNELQDRFLQATPEEQSLLTYLQLWAESIYPVD